MDDRITLPGSWLFDPLLRGRHIDNWVSIKKRFVSDNAELAIQKALITGKNPIKISPWWSDDPVMVDEYERYRKIYGKMDNSMKEKTAIDLEQYIGLVRVNAPIY
jgi:hypothetical protein